MCLIAVNLEKRPAKGISFGNRPKNVFLPFSLKRISALTSEALKYWKYFLLSLVVILIDQGFKLWVYNNMAMGDAGEIYVLGDWFRLHYLLNPGMAFGLKIDAVWGKLLLTVFRIGAIGAIAYYMYIQAQKGMHIGMLWCMALILGGAVGNAVDSIFYGVLLDNAPYDAPTPWFHGQVIDMLYFPIIDGNYPDWFPAVGGDRFQFFRPVFNIADSAIFLGVLFILLFQRRFLATATGSSEEDELEIGEVPFDGELQPQEPTTTVEEQSGANAEEEEGQEEKKEAS